MTREEQRKVIAFLMICFTLFIGCAECEKAKPVFKETRSDFEQGEIILPDYAHDDTLIVINAGKLNEAIEQVATDSEIDSVLHLYCEPYESGMVYIYKLKK